MNKPSNNLQSEQVEDLPASKLVDRNNFFINNAVKHILIALTLIVLLGWYYLSKNPAMQKPTVDEASIKISQWVEITQKNKTTSNLTMHFSGCFPVSVEKTPDFLISNTIAMANELSKDYKFNAADSEAVIQNFYDSKNCANAPVSSMIYVNE